MRRRGGAVAKIACAALVVCLALSGCGVDEYSDASQDAGEDLTEREIWEERIMLGLRTADGIPSVLVYNRPPEDEDNYTPGEYIPDPQKYIDRLVPSLVPGNLRIPEDLWFIADDIISGIIA